MIPTGDASIDRINAWRNAHDVSIPEIAKRTGLHANTLYNVLLRRRSSCTLETLRALEALVPADFHVSSPSDEEGEREESCRDFPHKPTKICAEAAQ